LLIDERIRIHNTAKKVVILPMFSDRDIGDCEVGYSDYDFLKKIIEVHGYLGVKSYSRTLL
jgi:hypothetical protein